MTTAFRTTLGGLAALVLLVSCKGMATPDEPVTVSATLPASLLGTWVNETSGLYDGDETLGMRRHTITFTATDSDAVVGRKRWVFITEHIPNTRGIATGHEYNIQALTGDWTATDTAIERTTHEYDFDVGRTETSTLRKHYKLVGDERKSMFLVQWNSDSADEGDYRRFDQVDTPSFELVTGPATTWLYLSEFSGPDRISSFRFAMTFGSDGTFSLSSRSEENGEVRRLIEQEGTFEHAPENYQFITTLSAATVNGEAAEDESFLNQALVWAYTPHDSDMNGVADMIVVSPWSREMAWNSAAEVYEARKRVEMNSYWVEAVRE